MGFVHIYIYIYLFICICICGIYIYISLSLHRFFLMAAHMKLLGLQGALLRCDVEMVACRFPSMTAGEGNAIETEEKSPRRLESNLGSTCWWKKSPGIIWNPWWVIMIPWPHQKMELGVLFAGKKLVDGDLWCYGMRIHCDVILL